MKIRSFRPKTMKKMNASEKLVAPKTDSPTSVSAPIDRGVPASEEVRQRSPQPPRPSTNVVRLIPLGGMGDVTKNMYVYEYGEDIIIIDCGVGFPESEMLGIDLVIPDITYLRDKVHRIKGIIITHGHDDHIGGLPYLWPELKCPIYAQKLTAGLIKGKFYEHKLPKDQIKTLKVDDKLQLGAFGVEFYRISHSIPDTVGIVLHTPIGNLIHQADFKIDWTPVIGQPPDVGKIAAMGNQGIVFMTIDCLRVEKTGYTLSERMIEPSFHEVEEKSSGKVLITMTSSNVSRIQQAINVAVKSGRKLALAGRSLEGNFQIAWDLGYLQVPSGLVIPQEEIRQFPDNKLMILIAGSQGQPGSALSRAANGDHKHVFLKKGDAVIFSADPIPSTEMAQSALIDSLTRTGCTVYYSAMMSDLHVSGHAAQEELKMMLNLIKPQSILPIGGTFRHMKVFSNMAQNMGYQEKDILEIENGEILEISRQGTKVNGSIEVSNIYIDGLGVGDIGKVVLRDRKTLSEEGVVVVVVPIHRQSNKLAGAPDIITRGFVYQKESEDLIERSREIVEALFNNPKQREPGQHGYDMRYLRNQIEEQLERFFYKATNRRPMILPIVVDL